MRLMAALLVVLAVLSSACADDDAVGALSDAEREWCTFDDASEESAFRFDLIFEAGLALGLPMDAMNARASTLRSEYTEQGMSDDEAVRAVSRDLLEEEDFVAACKQAYLDNVGG